MSRIHEDRRIQGELHRIQRALRAESESIVATLLRERPASKAAWESKFETIQGSACLRLPPLVF